MKFQPRIEELECRNMPAQFTSVASSLWGDAVLKVQFKEDGLERHQYAGELLTGEVEVQYQWATKGGNTLQGQPFSSTVQLSVTKIWNSANNNTILGTFYVYPPPPTAEFLAAPHASNWVAVVTVTYTGMTLTDTYNGGSISVPDVSGSAVVKL